MLDIIAVDDESSIRHLLEAFFHSRGWNGLVFGSARDALAYLGRNTVRLVMTDINMPGMRGDLFARHVRESFPKMPIVAFTGSVDELDLNPADITRIIAKPASLDEIDGMLRHYLGMPWPVSGT